MSWITLTLVTVAVCLLLLGDHYGWFETKALPPPNGKIARCDHCNAWVTHEDDYFIDGIRVYHGYCWDKTEGDLKGVLPCKPHKFP